jgi:hypothetical protein
MRGQKRTTLSLWRLLHDGELLAWLVWCHLSQEQAPGACDQDWQKLKLALFL